MAEAQQPVTVPKPGQWDSAFDANMSASDVQKLKTIAPFRSMDPESFPANASLDDILANETRIRSIKKGGIIIRQGDYGSSAFLILSGSVSTVFDIPDSTLGRASRNRKSFMQALKQLWTNPSLPEVRDVEKYRNRVQTSQGAGDGIVYLQDFPVVLQQHKNMTLKAGALFGEISALTRAQRAASIIANTDCELLEIKWQGLRDLMRYSKDLRKYIEKLYRERSLTGHLASIELFKTLPEQQINAIAKNTTFETYGRFDWHVAFKSAVKKQDTDLITSEPVVVKEGEYADDLILIRSGFARVSKEYNNGHRTVTYLTRGDVFELETILHNCSSSEHTPYRYSLRALGYIDILKIPSAIVKQYVLPAYIAKHGQLEMQTDDDDAQSIDMSNIEQTDLLSFLVENRFINGTKTMLINLDRCVGCDDCVTACANAHDNNPRFIRHGARHGKFMVANACMHCNDPVCMIGCPTGAIHRTKTGEVIINDVTCIGCATCANSCPYNNIRMVNVRSGEGTLLLDEKFNPIVKATKCDLCYDQRVSPACEYACPHDALKRIDIRDLGKLSTWIN
jgi:Fe-S-cluster-containing dehydrogenase component/CRP-like cAMP-binding protein